MTKFLKNSIFKIVGVGSASFAWIYFVIQVLIGALSFSPFGFFT
ncbi:MAG: hypothetical protein ACTSR7_19910 [Promethearchaeota archaeon]